MPDRDAFGALFKDDREAQASHADSRCDVSMNVTASVMK
jgi:hypothetical protein